MTPTRQTSIGVVVVNWNGWRDTLQAHESLLRSEHRDLTLIVIDNASSDGSAEEIAQHAPTAELIRSPRNLGFAGGCNLGIARVRALGLRYVMLLNNDAMVRPDTLGALAATSAKLDDTAILGAQVRFWPGGKIQFFGSRKKRSACRPVWFRPEEADERLAAELIATDFVFGAALFAPVALFDRLGDFDERYFLNFEETDWCYRASRAGVPLYIVPAATVDHRGGGSIGAPDGPLQTYFMVRNRLLFARTHATALQRLRTYAETEKAVLLRLAQGVRAPATEATILGVRDYLANRFGDCPARIRELATRPNPP
jgi:GT2 family glycosyltransferase